MGDSLFFRNKHYAKGTIAKIRYCNQVFVATYKGKINARMQDDKHICFNVFLGCV